MIAQQNWWQLSSIQIGGAICLPVIMIGHFLCQTYGFTSSVIAILIGNGILLILGLISAKMSYEKKKTTMDNARDYFGEMGSSFFSLTMVFSLLGWFGIQLNMMSISMIDLLSLDSNYLISLNTILGLLITFVALRGISAINLLANLSLPLLVLTLVYSLFTLKSKSEISHYPISIVGASSVIAMAIAVVIDLPTFFRHAKSCKHGFISIVIIFGLALPSLEIIGVYLSSGIAGGTILDVLKRQEGPFWNLWIGLFLILAGWTTNNLNLYSAVICLEPLLKNNSEKKRTLMIGVFGTLLSCFNLLDNIEIVLDIMGILITSMGTVIITRYLLSQFNHSHFFAQNHLWNILAWTLGISAGFFSLAGISFTTIPVLDAAIGAGLAALFIPNPKEIYEKTYL